MAMYFYITMEIRDIQDNILIDTLVTQDAVKVDELMKQHNITLSWVAVSNEQLPLGAYIDYDGVRYSLLEPYSPEQTDEATYSYKPIFHHPVMRWQYLPFFHYIGSNKELDWSLTDNAANFMSAVIKAVNNETGESWSYEVSSALPASASLSFSNTDIFSALNSIAGAFETEWWFDYSAKTVYLSKAYNGSAVTLEVGKNIGVPSKTGGKEGYFTRFYAFGSTRNIEQNYAGSNVNSIVNKRLTLDPQKYPDGYIDIREGLTNSEILVKTLVFDDIYPRSSLTISDVKVRLMWRLDDDNKKVQIGTDSQGKPVYDQYAIWYFKIPDFTFRKDLLISGKALSVHFNSGPLSGRDFELTYHEKAKEIITSDGVDFYVEAGDYEINFVEEGTFIIPAITGLTPVDGNEVTLFNIAMPEEYKVSAYAELEQAVLKEMAKQAEVQSNYTFDSNKVAFYTENPNLTIGSVVDFKNGNDSVKTRVIKLETKLDYLFEQKITVGTGQIKGTTQTLKEEVVNANQNIDLLAAINESTTALQQALQRAQKLMQDNMAQGLFELVNVGTEEAPTYALRPAKYKKQPVGILSDTFITAKGVNEDDSSLFSVLNDWSKYNGDPNEVLSANLGYELLEMVRAFEGTGGSSGIDVSILEKYLTKSEAEKTYTPLTTFNTYKETTDKRLESLEAMFGWYPSNEKRESIKANAGLWTDSFITARGINGNLDGEVFVRLDRWEDYNADSDEGQVLSAKLGWELLQMVTNGSGSGSVDLTGYVKTEELNTKLQGYYTKIEVTAELSKYQTLISSSNKIPYSYISGTPTIPSTSNFLSINGGTINGDLRLQRTGENYGTYLRFGDSNYAYIAEINDDELTIKATEIHLNGSVFVNGVAYSGGSDVDLDNYVTFDDLDGYAETSWVSDNFLSLDGGEINGSLDVNGSFYATSITHGSDIRHKSILNDIAEDVDFIANAPLFNFTWNNDTDKTPRLGTSAQYWLDTEFCEAVSYDKKNDFYGLAYGELGVAMGILNARKIVSHEERIKVLEAENAALKTELNGLRRRIG